ncbi:MAG: tetraacyldisaccharide 4'-kinase [Gammaproteobacteria bacterium]
MSAAIHRLVEEIWYSKHPLRVPLLPLSWLFRAVAWGRRAIYTSRLLNVYRAPVPVIVVGNICVGGSGKTPLVIWLAGRLRHYGFRPGIVARGYRGRARSWPQQVRADADAVAVGDEAIVLARRTGLPLAVGPSRAQDIKALLRHADVNIILCDDGLQHYALERDIEIAVVDGVRRHGNGACLPAGPLREPPSRLEEVDLVVTHGIAARGEFSMRYRPGDLRRVGGEGRTSLEAFRPKTVHAVAAIGNPQGFFAVLKRHGFRFTPHAFPDHHRFRAADFDFGDELPIVMTEKDAVKCEHLADARFWYLPIDAELPDVFERRLKTLLKRVLNGPEAA